jgi:cytochrome c5
MRARVFAPALALAFALALIAAITPSRAQQGADPLPAGEGHDLVAVACSQCHYLGTIAKIRDGAPGWRRYVDIMVLRGAQLTKPEIDTVVAYLARNLGPGMNLPPAKPVALPDGPGKDLIADRCTLCHDLERLVAVKRQRPAWPIIVADMVVQGAPVTAEEAKTISDYLDANFGD